MNQIVGIIDVDWPDDDRALSEEEWFVFCDMCDAFDAKVKVDFVQFSDATHTLLTFSDGFMFFKKQWLEAAMKIWDGEKEMLNFCVEDIPDHIDNVEKLEKYINDLIDKE